MNVASVTVIAISQGLTILVFGMLLAAIAWVAVAMGLPLPE
jgi:hypothetical protein